MTDFDVAPILEHYGATLTRSSGSFTIRCPFHDDHHKSGSVDSDRGLFNCFVCNQGGDAVAIIMWQEGLTYRDAHTRAQEIAGTGGGAVRSHADRGGYGLPRGKGDSVKRRRVRPAWRRR